jgi:hypothetical protein
MYIAEMMGHHFVAPLACLRLTSTGTLEMCLAGFVCEGSELSGRWEVTACPGVAPCPAPESFEAMGLDIKPKKRPKRLCFRYRNSALSTPAPHSEQEMEKLSMERASLTMLLS